MLTDDQKKEVFAQLPEIYGEVAVFASHLTGWEGDSAPRYQPTGATSFDLTHSAVVRLAVGKRSWAPGVGLVNTLKAIVRSGHSNLWRSGAAEEVSLDAPRSAERAERPDEDGARTYGDALASPLPNPEQVLLAKEHDAILNAQLEEALSGDVEGLALVAAILDGAETPREMAADLGLPVERVKVIRRRLQRRLKALAREWRKRGQARDSNLKPAQPGLDRPRALAVRPPRPPNVNRAPPAEAAVALRVRDAAPSQQQGEMSSSQA